MTQKHHQDGSPSAWSQWSKRLTDDEEFGTFDLADVRILENTLDGDMFGLLSDRGEGRPRVIGSRGEQLAFFPQNPVNLPWHGYPVSLGRSAPKIPTEQVWNRMLDEELVDEVQVARLKKGKNA